MDPISVSASIAGLITAAVQVSALLKRLVENVRGAPQSALNVLVEVNGIGLCLNQLREYIHGTQSVSRSRASFIMIEQVVVVLTDCLTIFSELEQVLETLQLDAMKVIDKMKWTAKEATILQLLARLQTSKTSLSLMLTTLTCVSVDEAHASVQHLTTLVQQLLDLNADMSRRLRTLESPHHPSAHGAPIKLTSPGTGSDDEVEPPPTYSTEGPGNTFEKDLSASRVYGRASLNPARLSVVSSTNSVGWSLLSGLSLSDISNLSTISLPISSRELWNYHRYSVEPHMASCGLSPLDAWYNPPANMSACIRSSPRNSNGDYVNQYCHFNTTGEVRYTRVSSVKHPGPPPVSGEYWASFKSQIA
ncbi:MAG: hypothetical protein Q9187_002992 [Circinaria calcarea]